MDLAKRAGILSKNKNKKRKAVRSGMGNSESSYGSEESSLDEFEMVAPVTPEITKA